MGALSVGEVDEDWADLDAAIVENRAGMDMPKTANVRVAGVREKRIGIIERQVVWRGKAEGREEGMEVYDADIWAGRRGPGCESVNVWGYSILGIEQRQPIITDQWARPSPHLQD